MTWFLVVSFLHYRHSSLSSRGRTCLCCCRITLMANPPKFFVWGWHVAAVAYFCVLLPYYTHGKSSKVRCMGMACGCRCLLLCVFLVSLPYYTHDKSSTVCLYGDGMWLSMLTSLCRCRITLMTNPPQFFVWRWHVAVVAYLFELLQY